MMEVNPLSELVLTNLAIRHGRIAGISADGEIQVENDNDDLPVSCEFLRTSAGPLPELHPGDTVLYAMDELTMRGYVLGVIQKYHTNEQEFNGDFTHSETEQDIREIKFNATEKIELRCGESLLMMNQDGKIVVRGTSITTRASGPQKIKGATVQIN